MYLISLYPRCIFIVSFQSISSLYPLFSVVSSQFVSPLYLYHTTEIQSRLRYNMQRCNGDTVKIQRSYNGDTTKIQRRYNGDTGVIQRRYNGDAGAIQRRYNGSRYRGDTTEIPGRYNENTTEIQQGYSRDTEAIQGPYETTSLHLILAGLLACRCSIDRKSTEAEELYNDCDDRVDAAIRDGHRLGTCPQQPSVCCGDASTAGIGLECGRGYCHQFTFLFPIKTKVRLSKQLTNQPIDRLADLPNLLYRRIINGLTGRPTDWFTAIVD